MSVFKKLLFTIGILPIFNVTYGQAWTDISPVPIFHWQCETGNSTFNHNPALQITDTVLVFDSLPYIKDYTMIVVYKPMAEGEVSLWQLSYGDSATRGLTTERILSDSISIRYATQTDGSPAINTLRQSWPASLANEHPNNGTPDSTAPYVRLSIGGAGALKVSEVLYYAGRLGNATLRKVQSTLAVRYGITLGPVDYLDGAGRHVWDYADSGMYHHRVTGVGIDTLTGLYQMRSRSEMTGAILTIATDSLERGSFLMVGDNDAPLAFEQDGEVEVLERNWKIQASRTTGRYFSLTFDTRTLATPGDSLVLLVDNNIYLPERIGTDNVVFEGIEFPTDSSLFTLGRGGLFWQWTQSSGAKGAGRHDEETGISNHFYASLYPNPTNGHYVLDVERAGEVQVTIYNVQGSVVASFHDDGREQYRFEGDLPTGNVYYATVTTESGSQTIKLIVK